ncbi:uncharacterized protein [Argopecten irradians]|uniref:uncharacterized protein n=1 Tax=Argopecten irradians TaxID=31199 RepID=UPI003716FBAD
MSKTVLRLIYRENVNKTIQNEPSTSEVSNSGNNQPSHSRHGDDIIQTERSSVQTDMATSTIPTEGLLNESAHSHFPPPSACPGSDRPVQTFSPRSNNTASLCATTGSASVNSGNNNSMADMVNLMQGMQQQMLLIQQSMALQQNNQVLPTSQLNNGSLRSAYEHIERVTQNDRATTSAGESHVFINQHMGPNGIHPMPHLDIVTLPPDLMPHLDIVTPSLRKHILEGRDINLSTLLIPGYEISPSSHSVCHQHRNVDKRLADRLTIAEFILAFGKYRRIITDVFKQRQKELDMYESLIIRINTCYGEQAFNDYHKLFSAKAAEALRVNNTKLNWGLTDSAIYGMVTAGCKAKVCDLCHSITHSTQQCEKNNVNATAHQKPSKPKGKEKVFHEGIEICRNFQNEKGCSWSSCRYKHVCSACKSSSHGMHQCRNSKKPKSNSQ